MLTYFSVSGERAMQVLESGLKVKEFELLGRDFRVYETCFGFSIQEHITAISVSSCRNPTKVVQGSLGAVVDMACLYFEGTMEKGNKGAMHRINHVIDGLFNSLVELGEVQNMLEEDQSTRACTSSLEATNGVDVVLVAGTLMEMVGALISKMKSNPEVQKAIFAMQMDQASCSSIMVPKQPESSLVEVLGGSSKYMTTDCPDLNSRAPKIIVMSQARYTCTHVCAQHLGVIDPLVWNRLPDHLLELIFARLPLSQLRLIGCLSKAWLAKWRTPSFQRSCVAIQSKLFGFLSYHDDLEAFWMTTFDINSHMWYHQQLDEHAIEDAAMYAPEYAHDGGLVCCVRRWVSRFDDPDSIVISNPLKRNEWKDLPLFDFRGKTLILMQMVMDRERGCYRVMLVTEDNEESEKITADCYDSEIGLWSTMDNGVVYGSYQIFDCQKRVLFDNWPRDRTHNFPSIEGVECKARTSLKDRVFVLHERTKYRESGKYDITEFAWEKGDSWFLKKLRSFGCPMLDTIPKEFTSLLYATNDFLLLVADNGAIEDGYQHQVLRLFDFATKEWLDLPKVKGGPQNVFLETFWFSAAFMCELRWDAIP